MFLAGGGIAVIDVGGGHLLDAPDLGGGIVGDVVLGGVTGLIRVVELIAVGVNGLLKAVLEVAGDHDAGIGRGDDKAADVGHRIAAQLDIAVIQLVGLAIGGELGLIVDHGGQAGQLGVKAQRCGAIGCVDQIAGGIAQNGAALLDDIHIIGKDVQRVGDILVNKLRLALLEGIQRLALGNRAEVLTISRHEAHRVVAGDADILLGHLSIGVELLVLTVGADQTADEGEYEHGNEHGKAHNGQTVAEETLGNERAGAEDLDAAVIV